MGWTEDSSQWAFAADGDNGCDASYLPFANFFAIDAVRNEFTYKYLLTEKELDARWQRGVKNPDDLDENERRPK